MMETQHVEAASGAARAAYKNAETLAAHGVGEERRHNNRKTMKGGRSGQHTVRGDGQAAQDFARVGDTDGERSFSTPRGQ
jgi:hypothetical protein